MSSPDARSLLQRNIEQARSQLDVLGALAEPLQRAVDLLGRTLTSGGKVLCCGNGGSAADAAHLAAELLGRFETERPGFGAVDLTSNHALTTALINDYPPEDVFARQVRGLGAPGDALVALSTSGNSPNVERALAAAREVGLHTVAMLGRDGGRCRGLADAELLVPGDSTARIQEGHLLLYHTICAALDPILAAG
ncbi:MAG: phosphoheptose isomerase [Phycisphaeraceae bacterium]|nr:phosphoheptose isomerase [Phycisphaeraceae bacterium]